jgi:hypothetical protein
VEALVPFSPENTVIRPVTVISCTWDPDLGATILAVQFGEQILKVPVHAETGKNFYPGRVVSLRLVT